MPLSLFGYEPQSRVEDCIGVSSRYAHTFGGNSKDYGLSFKNAAQPLHIIYRIDLNDPVVPLQLSNAEFLPLLYGFNLGTECCYQVVSDAEIEILHPSDFKYTYPPWDAPSSFLSQPTSFLTRSFDPSSADDVMNWKGVFGWDQLSQAELDRALVLAKQTTSLSEDDGIDDQWTYKDVISAMHHPPFAQSKPYNSCKNPTCTDDQLRVIALQHDVVSNELIWPDELVQTIWEMCMSCHCITATNQCA